MDAVELKTMLGEGPRAVRAHTDPGCRRATGSAHGGRTRHGKVDTLVGAIPAKRDEAPSTRRGMDAAAVANDMRGGDPLRAPNDGGLAAGTRGREPDQIASTERHTLGDGIHVGPGGSAKGHDPLSVWRECGLLPEGRLSGDALGVAAAGGHPPKVAALLEVPVDEDQRPAIRGPHGGMLIAGKVSDLPGGAFCAIQNIQAPQRREGQLLAIWRGDGVADLLHGKGRGVFDGVAEVDLRPEREFHVRNKGDLLRRASVYRNAPDAPAVGGDQVARIGREGHPGVDITRGSGFHVVALDGEGEPALLVSGKVADAESRVGHVPGAIDQPPAVRREHGAEGATIAVGLDPGLAGVPIIGGELVVAQGRVVLPRTRSLRIPEGTAIGTEGRAGGPQVGGLGDERRPGPPIHVDLVELALAGTGLPGDDHVAAIRRKDRGLVGTRVAAGQLDRIGKIEGQEEDVFAAGAVRDEDHPGAIGREPGLGIEGHPAGEGGGFPPGNG